MSHMLQVCTKRFQWLTLGSIFSVRHGRNMADPNPCTVCRPAAGLPWTIEAHLDGAGRVAVAVRRFGAPPEIFHDAPGRPKGPSAQTVALLAELDRRIAVADEGVDPTSIAIEMTGSKNKADHLIRMRKNQRFK